MQRLKTPLRAHTYVQTFLLLFPEIPKKNKRHIFPRVVQQPITCCHLSESALGDVGIFVGQSNQNRRKNKKKCADTRRRIEWKRKRERTVGRAKWMNLEVRFYGYIAPSRARTRRGREAAFSMTCSEAVAFPLVHPSLSLSLSLSFSCLPNPLRAHTQQRASKRTLSVVSGASHQSSSDSFIGSQRPFRLATERRGQRRFHTVVFAVFIVDSEIPISSSLFFLFSFLAKKPGLFTIFVFLRRERKQQTQVADIGEPQTLWGFEWRPVYVKNSTKMRWWFPRRQTHTNRYSKGDRKRKTQTLIIWEIECKEDEEEEETGEAVECRRNAICCSNDARFSRSSRGVSLLPSSSSS